MEDDGSRAGRARDDVRWPIGRRPVLAIGRRRVPMVGEAMLIGRVDRAVGVAPGLDLTDDDPARLVSRRHAELRLDGAGLWLTDLGSGNGTVVDGRTIRSGERYEILPGSTLTVGDVVITVGIEPDRAADVRGASAGAPTSRALTNRPEADGDRVGRQDVALDIDPNTAVVVGESPDDERTPEAWAKARVDHPDRRPRDFRETTYLGDEWGGEPEDPVDEPTHRASRWQRMRRRGRPNERR